MQIQPLHRNNKDGIRQVVRLLIQCFESWPDPDDARNEVLESLGSDRISLIASDDDGNILGWIAGVPQYSGKTWELHPLAVDAEFRNIGIGRALVKAFEEGVRERGGLTIFLGTDDEDSRTSISDRDLYPDVTRHINAIRNLSNHPFEFYQKLGYVIIGILPDANGWGKPDILMAKRLWKHPKDPIK